MNEPRVSVIVPTYNREEVLVETLGFLLKLEYSDWELIVVDQTKDHQPAVQKALEELAAAKKIRWFYPPEVDFASLTKARNFGMNKAHDPEIFLFVDDDVEVQPDFIRQHVKAYEDSEVGATVGKVKVPGHHYPEPPYRVGHITWMGDFVNNFHGDEEVESDNFIGCNFSLRASVVKETGLFDEEFVNNAMREDSDMAVRVREVGKKIRYLPKAAMVHKAATTGGTRSQEDRIKWYYSFFYNDLLFYAKHAPAWRLPFFVLHLARPILACSLYYGRGRLGAILTPWRGIRDGVRAAKRSRQKGEAVPRRSRPVF